MKTVCNSNQCAGCMACVDICPKQCISVVDDIQYMNAVIDQEKCVNCNACHKVCGQNNPAELLKPLEWYQGWAKEEIRRKSSSGGLASALERAFIDHGGVVAACKLIEGDFKFAIARTIEELNGFAGSKYVKSNPIGIYREVKSELMNGNKVLFLGLPCQVSSMKNYAGERYQDNLYTIDLICHGTPSIKILRKALKEYGTDINNCKEILFRRNDRFNVEHDLKYLTPDGIQDFYTKAFLRGIDYTDNCYSCHYATESRVGDIMLGDSWGSELVDELPKGLSLIFVQSEKGEKLLRMVDVVLKEVDLDRAKVPNTQLCHPTEIKPEHDVFFKHFMKGRSFKYSVAMAWPKECFKTEIKCTLNKMGLYEPLRNLKRKIRGGINVPRKSDYCIAFKKKKV